MRVKATLSRKRCEVLASRTSHATASSVAVAICARSASSCFTMGAVIGIPRQCRDAMMGVA